MNEPIQAIIFDVGGVLVRTHDQSGRRAWEERLGLAPGQLEAIVLNSEMGHRAQRGEISDDDLWAWVSRRFGLGDELDAFRRDFWRGDAVDHGLVALVGRLNRRYQTAIISNATDALLTTLEDYQLLVEFDLVVGSAYEGLMKPAAAIFETTLIRLGREAAETVFIDDAPANIAGAQAVGLQTILFTPALDLAAELAALGVRSD